MAELGPSRRTTTTRPASGRSSGQQQPEAPERPGTKLNPVLIFLLIFVLPLGLIIFTVVRIMDTEDEQAVQDPIVRVEDPYKEFRAAITSITEKKMPEAQRRYKEISKKAREDREDDEARQKFEKELKDTRAYIQSVQKELVDLLKPIRDKNGGTIPDDFTGYARHEGTLQQWLSDLNRYGGF